MADKITYVCMDSCLDIIPTRDATEHFDLESQVWVVNEGNQVEMYCPECGGPLEEVKL